MNKSMLAALMSATVLLAGCGGGAEDKEDKTAGTTTRPGGTTSPTTPSGPTAPTKPAEPTVGNVNGLVFDGPVEKAVVFCDLNRNSVQDASEAKAVTDRTGKFNIQCPVGNTLVVVADGIATDTAARVDMRGILKGYVQQETQGFTQLNALSTVAVEMMGQGAAASEAENQIRTAFDIPTNISIYGHHPAANLALINAVLSTQTTLLSATGELAFVDRAASASDNPTINAIHLTLNQKMAKLLRSSIGSLDLAAKVAMVKKAIQDATTELASNASVSEQVRARMQKSPVPLQDLATIAAKIALDRHETQFALVQRDIESLDLTGKLLPAEFLTKIKNASTWTTRYSDPKGLHQDTSPTGLPLESTYVKSFGGFIQMDDGSYIDPVFTDDGTFAFPVDVSDDPNDPNRKIVEFNRTGHPLAEGFTERLYYDPFTDPQRGFSVLVFKQGSVPDGLVGTNMVYGNVKPNIEPNGKYAAIPIPLNDGKRPPAVFIYSLISDPTKGVAVGLRGPDVTLDKLPLGSVVPQKGDPYVIVYYDLYPQDNHGIILMNNGLSGKGIRSFMTPVRIW
jgi:hypothetical protein